MICKLEEHRGGPLRGYVAMLAVKTEYRGKGIATKLVRMAVDAMIAKDADEVGIAWERKMRLANRMLDCIGNGD